MRRIYLCMLILFIWTAFAAADDSRPEKRMKVASILIEGNEAFEDGRLVGLMITRPHRFFARSYYRPGVLDEDIGSINRFYKANGYLEAEAAIEQVAFDSARAEAAITITVKEGPLTTVEGVSIFGARSFPDSLLVGLSRVKPGDPFKGRQLQDGILAMLSHYADHGYLDAVIKPDVRINREVHTAFVDIIVSEKGRSKIGTIRIESRKVEAPPAGADSLPRGDVAAGVIRPLKTRDNVILRELTFRAGETAKYSKLLESQRNLYMTGLFQSVFIRPVHSDRDDSTTRDILIEIEENVSLESNIYIGYGSVELGRAKLEILNNNLRGSARKLGFSVFASFINHGAEASFSEPRTFGWRWKTDLNLLYEYREEPAYIIRKGGGWLVLGRSFGENSNMSMRYRYERSELKDVKVESEAVDLENDIRSLRLSLVFDSRDNLFNASSGSYLEWSGEFAGSFLLGSEDFWKMTWRMKRFRSLGRSTVVGSAFDVGWADYFGRSNTVPLNERFYLGGPDVLRGFEYRRAGGLDENGEPVGGNFRLVANMIEIRQVVYRMIGVAAFFDIGGIWQQPSAVRMRGLRYCPGAGLRVNTPIGIIRADYGINIDRKDDEPAGHIYVSVGQSF